MPAGNATVAALADTLVEEMPPVQAHAVEQHKAENATIDTPAPPSADPAPPKRGRGRPPGSGKKSKVAQPGASSNVASAPQAPPDQTAAIAMSAGALTSITLLAGTIIGGPDFAPGPNPLLGGKNDQEFLQAAYFDYCKAKGVQDVPPGVALTAALMIYVTPRLSKPQTQTRLGAVGKWIGNLWSKLRKRGASNAARVYSGNDGERQNHAGAPA